MFFNLFSTLSSRPTPCLLRKLELEAVEKRLQRKLQADPDHLRKLELEAKRKQVQRAQREGRKVSRQTAFEFALGVVEPEEVGEE